MNILRKQPAATALWFGAASAFKFQALFFALFLLVLLLTRRLLFVHLLLLPLGPIAFALPAVLGGRPPMAIARILFDQADTYHQLSMNAANLWEFVPQMFYSAGARIAFALTLVAIIFYAWKSLKQHQPSECWLLLSATVGLSIMPFFLPKMHDRYFFPAELFCVALACALPAFRLPAAFMQLSSLLVYSNYLLDLDARPKIHLTFTFAAVGANTTALYFLANRYLELKSSAVLTTAGSASNPPLGQTAFIGSEKQADTALPASEVEGISRLRGDAAPPVLSGRRSRRVPRAD